MSLVHSLPVWTVVCGHAGTSKKGENRAAEPLCLSAVWKPQVERIYRWQQRDIYSVVSLSMVDRWEELCKTYLPLCLDSAAWVSTFFLGIILHLMLEMAQTSLRPFFTTLIWNAWTCTALDSPLWTSGSCVRRWSTLCASWNSWCESRLVRTQWCFLSSMEFSVECAHFFPASVFCLLHGKFSISASPDLRRAIFRPLRRLVTAFPPLVVTWITSRGHLTFLFLVLSSTTYAKTKTPFFSPEDIHRHLKWEIISMTTSVLMSIWLVTTWKPEGKRFASDHFFLLKIIWDAPTYHSWVVSRQDQSIL